MLSRGLGIFARRAVSASVRQQHVRRNVLKSVATATPVHQPSSFHLFSTAAQEDNEEFSFQAETSQLLNIVTHSLYTDKEVFLRELISNSADALEKLRHAQVTGEKVIIPDQTMDIRISTDAENGTLTIEDSGIGLNKGEMVDHLGTIARSGSKAFLESAKNADNGDEAASNIIGQFGVGFYSAFMVGDKVEVFSKSATGSDDDVVNCWTSDGIGAYSIRQVPDSDLKRGTRIVIHLRDDQKEYADDKRVKDVINRYSNFVSYPIVLNDEKVNTMEAIWAKEPSSITEEQYTEFYRFASHSFDEPSLRLHFRTDAPIDLKALLFVPTIHSEKFGMERMKPGVSVYSRKVLLEANSDKMLPGWLRFIKGVVDSEDLPLSISRESMQDSRLLEKLNRVVTKKLIRHFAQTAKKDADKYKTFWNEFGNFLREGVCSDYENQQDIAKLLRFSSSSLSADELTSFDEYVSRLKPDQESIYYLSAPSRDLALASPYYEVFKANNVEVLFLHHTMEDFVMNNLGAFNGRNLVAAESGLDMKVEDKDGEDNKEDGEDGKDQSKDNKLTTQDAEALKDWMQEALGEHVSTIELTTRLVNFPAVLVDHESAALRRMMKMVNADAGEANPFLAKQKMEINVNHPIIIALNEMRNTNPQVAETVARQVFDNALIASGLVDDPREMVPRLNKLLETLLQEKKE